MRVLLDENLDRRLKKTFGKRLEVLTVVERGRSGKKNDKLLRLAEQEFDMFVTMDRNIEYQQNLDGFEFGVLLITAKGNRRSDIEPTIMKANALIEKVQPGKLFVVDV